MCEFAGIAMIGLHHLFSERMFLQAKTVSVINELHIHFFRCEQRFPLILGHEQFFLRNVEFSYNDQNVNILHGILFACSVSCVGSVSGCV